MNLSALVKKAKQDVGAAEKDALVLLQDLFPLLKVQSCRINTSSKVSLNSVNGFLKSADGRELFFKFHAEEGEEESLKDSEYYRAALLEKQGWPIIAPVATSTMPGRQCVVYEKCTAPTAYDAFGAQDSLFLKTGVYDEKEKAALLKAEEDYLKKTTAIMLESLRPAQGTENEKAAIHQLFSHRLHGVSPRLDLFYQGKHVMLPHGRAISFDELAQKEWVINGLMMPHSLGALIAFCKKNLYASASNSQPCVIGHGDDHNGNKFFMGGQFIAFDPAFAGWQPALLAPIKATLHNALLHPFWYYEPVEVMPKLMINCAVSDKRIEIIHNANAILASPLRQAILTLHRQYVWQPLLAALKQRGLRPDHGDEFLRCAAFCCPFLALNMIDPARGASPLFNLGQCVALFHHNFFSEII